MTDQRKEDTAGDWTPRKKNTRLRKSVIRRAPSVTNPFQSLITAIEKAMAPKGARVTASYEFYDGGIPREADILIEASVGGHVVKIAIECRDHQAEQDVKWIDGLVGRYDRTTIDKVVAVSTTAFTAAAQEKAKNHNIELITFREAVDSDWSENLIKTQAKLISVYPNVINVRFECEGRLPLPSPDRLIRTNVMDSSGRLIGDVASLAQKLYEENCERAVAESVNSNSELYFGNGIDSSYNFDSHLTFLETDGKLENFDGRLSKIIFSIRLDVRFEDIETKHYSCNDSRLSILNATIDGQERRTGILQFNDTNNERQFKIIFDRIAANLDAPSVA